MTTQIKSNKPYSLAIIAGAIALGAISAWRLLAIAPFGRSASVTWWLAWLGLSAGLSGLWLGLGALLRGLSWSGSKPRVLVMIIGAAFFGLTGFLLTKPAGISKVTIELYAENVWHPHLFTLVWNADGSGYNRFVLPTGKTISPTLELIATGQHHPDSKGAEVVLASVILVDGEPLSLRHFQQTEKIWTRESISWKSYKNQTTWVVRDEYPATLFLKDPLEGPITLIFAKSPRAGQVTIRWDGAEVASLDLYAPDTALQSITLPLHEPVVWRTTLPMSVLGEGLSIFTQLDPGGNLGTILTKAKLIGLPGQPLELSGHALADAFRVEEGWAELAPNGIRINAVTPNNAPRLFITDRFIRPTLWSRLLPSLENLLIALYVAAFGAAIVGFLTKIIWPQTPAPQTLTNFNLTAATLFILFLAGEIALRWLLPTPDAYYIWEPNLHFVFNPRPDLVTGVQGETNVVINSQGIRGDELKSTDTYQILAIGGSTTEALYLDQAEAWPYLIQQGLNQNQTGGQVWVGNAGRSGHNTREHIVQLQHLLPQYPDLDALIVLVGINDFGLRLEQAERYDPAYLDSPGAVEVLMARAFDAFPTRVQALEPYYQQSAVWRLFNQLQTAQAQSNNEVQKVYVQDDDGAFLIKRWQQRQQAEIREDLPDLSTSLAEYRRNLNHIIDLAETSGVRVILLTQPTLWRPDLTEAEQSRLWFGWGPNFDYFYSVTALSEGMAAYNATLLDVCQVRQVECLDLASLLPKDTTVFYDDVHFNESGSRQVSQALIDYLRTQVPFAAED